MPGFKGFSRLFFKINKSDRSISSKICRQCKKFLKFFFPMPDRYMIRILVRDRPDPDLQVLDQDLYRIRL